MNSVIVNALLFLFNMCICVSDAKTIQSPCVFKPNDTLCYCSKTPDYGLYVNCSNQNLSFIPNIRLPNVKYLDLSRNCLKKINVSMLNNIEHKGLTYLDISRNLIQMIDNNSLAMFQNLTYLDMSSNHMSTNNLRVALLNLSTSISILKLNNMSIGNFQEDMFEPLSNSKLVQMELQYNKFRTLITKKLFEYLPHIRVLNVSANYIQYTNFTESHSLRILGLTKNNINEFPMLCSDSKPLFPNLTELFLDKNCIFRLKMNNINCLDKLQILNISQTNIHTIYPNTFSRLKSLKILALEYSSSLDYIYPAAFNSTSLERIYIRNNDLMFYPPFIIPATVFDHCSQLTHLDISGNTLGHLTDKTWKRMLKYIANLVYLDISQSKLLYLPAAIGDQVHLVQLHFTFNEITNLRPNYFIRLRNLTRLYLNANKITHVNSGELPNHRLTQLNLAFNPFVCDCDLLWFVTFLKENRNILRHYPKEYECTDDSRLLADLQMTIKSCLITPLTSTVIQCVCFTVMCLIVLYSSIYRYRWRIRYMFYILNYKRRTYIIRDNRNYSHDIYVSCSEPDFNSVFEILVQKLENDGFSVYIPQRDATPGGMIVKQTLEQIDKCAQRCRRTSKSAHVVFHIGCYSILEKQHI